MLAILELYSVMAEFIKNACRKQILSWNVNVDSPAEI
jgi:hypothetical protein